VDTTVPAPPQARLVRRPRTTLGLLRALLTVHLLAMLGQPILAGLFLTGHVDAIAVHGIVGSVLVVFTMLVGVAALAYVMVVGGRWWVLAAVVLLFLAEGLQVGTGYARVLQVHIPLGVLIVTLSVLLAGWVWTPSAGRAG
jgi:hypothetical protein